MSTMIGVGRLSRTVTTGIGRCYTTVLETFSGLLSFASGVGLIARTPSLWYQCLKCTPVTLALVAMIATSLWLAASLMKLLVTLVVTTFGADWIDVDKLNFGRDDAMRAAAMFVFTILRVFLPQFSSSSFFAVLAVRNKSFCANLAKMEVIHGPASQAWQLAKLLIVLVSLVAGVVFLGPAAAPVFGPLGVAVVAAFSAVVAFGWAAVAVFAALAVLTSLFGWGLTLLSPFIKLWKQIDPVIAVIALAVVAMGFLRVGAISSLATHAISLYLACTYFTRQLLAAYVQRQEWSAWTVFSSRHRWRLFGFGLPTWVLAQYSPLVGVVCLEVLDGAAAVLLSDLVEHDQAQGSKAGSEGFEKRL